MEDPDAYHRNQLHQNKVDNAVRRTAADAYVIADDETRVYLLTAHQLTWGELTDALVRSERLAKHGTGRIYGNGGRPLRILPKV